jgi:hypothetical protein
MKELSKKKLKIQTDVTASISSGMFYNVTRDKYKEMEQGARLTNLFAMSYIGFPVV